jgi:membrane protease subunit HflC
MSRTLMIIGGIVVIVAGIGIFGTMFTVPQTEQAIVLQFGKPLRIVTQPGLHFKVPLFQNVEYFERRVLDLEPPRETIILSDQKRLDVDAYLRYRITDPLRFKQSVTNEVNARQRLSQVVNSRLRDVLGKVTLLSVLSEERESIMADIRKAVNEEAKNFGVEIVDFRIRRADLPEQAAQAIFARMRSEREREAREARAQGFEKAQEIRAAADRERTVLLAEAEKNSEILRGEGDRQAIKIYADSFGQDPQFFRFYRSMQAYRKALSGDDTTMVLSPDSEFFRYFGELNTDGAAAGGK